MFHERIMKYLIIAELLVIVVIPFVTAYFVDKLDKN